MSELEENLSKRFPLKPSFWLRFVDDIFLLWQHGEEILKGFIKVLNNVHSAILLPAEYSLFGYSGDTQK